MVNPGVQPATCSTKGKLDAAYPIVSAWTSKSKSLSEEVTRRLIVLIGLISSTLIFNLRESMLINMRYK